MKRTTKNQGAELTRGKRVTMSAMRIMVYVIIIYGAFATTLAR